MRRALLILGSLACVALGAGLGTLVGDDATSASPSPAAPAIHFSPAVPVVSLGTASVSDVSCVEDRTQHHTVLVYAWTPDVGNRSTRLAPLLRRAAYGASATLDDAARLHGGTAARIRLRCTGGVVDVLSIPLGIRSRSLTVGSILSTTRTALDAQGAFGWNTRAVVYVDAPHPFGTGTGGFADGSWLSSGDGAVKPPADNPHAVGGKIAVVLRTSATLPSTIGLLHEWLHTMGAVNHWRNGAGPPNGAIGHCTDGWDVMCYEDGGYRYGRPYQAGRCLITEVVDCGADDYFAPRPAAGTWLATHWNIATDAPTWLDYAPRGVAPTARPRNFVVRPYSSQAVRATWSAVAGAASYRVWCTGAQTGWRPGARVTGTSAIVEGIREMDLTRCRVHGEGPERGAGPMSAMSPNVRLPLVKPVRNMRVVGSTSTTITVAWDRPLQPHVARFEVWTGLYIQDVVKRGSTTGTRFTIRNLRPGRTYAVRAVAFDKAGNFGYGQIISARTR